MKFSLVIPCFNEEKNIPHLIKKCNIFKNKNTEIIIVDNGSTDNTKKILSKIKKNKFIKTIRIIKNIGYGNGIYSGLKVCSGDVIGWTHADLQTDLNDVLKSFKFFKNFNHNLYIKGRRRGRNFSDNLFTIGMSIFETILLKSFLWDINAQPNVFHRSFLRKITNPPKDFSFDLYVYYIAKINKLRLKRISVLFKDRIHGKSSWNINFKSKIKFIIRTIEYSLRLKKKIKYK
jgi:glycosyltransferase involved in cell wall biosynthesis